jgi:integrase
LGTFHSPFLFFPSICTAGLGTGHGSFRFHDLRHTFITVHAEANTPISVVQAQAGHLSPEMTRLYTHISQRSMEQAAERYEQRKTEAMAAAREKLEFEKAKLSVN